MALNTKSNYGKAIGSLYDIEANSKAFNFLNNITLNKEYAPFTVASPSRFLYEQRLSKKILEGGQSALLNNKPSSTPSEERVENSESGEIAKFVQKETSSLEAGDSEQVRKVSKELWQEASNQMIQNFYDIYMSPEGESTDIVYRLGAVDESLVYSENTINQISALLYPYLKRIPEYDGLSIFTPYNFVKKFKLDYFTNESSYSYKPQIASAESYVKNIVKTYSMNTSEPYNSNSSESYNSNTSETYTYISEQRQYKEQTLDYKVGTVNDTYINFLFPPYKVMSDMSSSYNQMSKNFTDYKSSHFDMRQGLSFNRNYPYRKIAFKQINDNISYLQWLMERVCGIVCTYFTEWDISLYVQEGLVTDSDGLSPKYITMLHRIQEDTPVINRDTAHTYPFGVLNASISKLFKSNEKTWIPNYYPYSKYWSSYPEYNLNKKYMSRTNPKSDIIFPSFYEIGYFDETSAGFESDNNSSLRKQLQFDDWQGAALSGYEDWRLNYYKALYTSTGDGLSDVDINQMAYSDKYVKNSELINENLKAVFKTQYPTSENSDFTSQDFSTATAINEDYGSEDEFKVDEINVETEDDSDDDRSELEKKYDNKDATSDMAMEIATGGNSSSFSASGISESSAGIMGSDEKTYDNAKTVGIPQRNPSLFGGPHSPYSSPLSLQAYFEMDNPFFRDIPRLNPQGITDTSARDKFIHDYELTNDYTFVDDYGRRRYDFSYLEKFSSTQYSYAEGGQEVGKPRGHEHSFTENYGFLKNGMSSHFLQKNKDIWNTDSRHFDITDWVRDIHNQPFIIAETEVYEQDPNDEGFDPRDPKNWVEYVRNSWSSWWYRGWWNTIRDLYRYWNQPPRYKFEPKTAIRLKFDDGDGVNHSSTENSLKYALEAWGDQWQTFYFFLYDGPNSVSSLCEIPLRVKTYPLLSSPDEEGRRAKVGEDWYIEADISNCLNYWGGLSQAPFNPSIKSDSLFEYRINGDNKNLDQNSCTKFNPSDDMSRGYIYIVKKFMFYNDGVTYKHIERAVYGRGIVSQIYLTQDPTIPLRDATFRYSSDYYWKTLNEEQDIAVKKALLYPTFYSSTQAPSYLNQVATSDKNQKFYKYDPIVSVKALLNTMMKQLVFLKEFQDFFIQNDKINWQFPFETIKTMFDNVKNGNPVISQKVFNLSDPDDVMIPDPADSEKKINKNKIFGFNRWIKYGREMFKHPFQVKALLILEIVRKINIVSEGIEKFKAIAKKSSFINLTMNDINGVLTELKTLHDTFFDVSIQENGKKVYNHSNIEKFFLSYLNILYETRKYFINKRCNKQDGTMYMMRALESAFPMIVQGANADTQEPDLENAGSPDFSDAKTNVAFYSVQNTNYKKTQEIKGKVLDDAPITIEDDRINYVFVPVEYASEEDYKNSEELVKESLEGDIDSKVIQKKVIKAVVGNETLYIKKPLDGRYRLESLELINNENNEIYNATLNKNDPDYFIKERPTMSIDIAKWDIVWGDPDYTKNDTPYAVKEDVSLLFGVVMDLNPSKVIEAVSIGVKEPQELICACKNPTDYWRIRVKDNLPRSSGYLNDVNLKLYDGYTETSKENSATIFGGLSAFTVSPIVKEQTNQMPMMGKALKEAQQLGNQTLQFGSVKEGTEMAGLVGNVN